MSFSIDLRSTVKTLGSEPLALGQAAVYLSSITRPGVSSEQYISHLKTMAEDVKQRFRALLHAGAEDTAETRLAALKHSLADKNGYAAVLDGTDPVQGCDITRVIDCAKGSDIILSILYIVAARAQGWTADGGQRLLFDPTQDCKIMHAPDLRKVLKALSGEQAELSAAYYDGVSDVETLIALQNRIKNRQIECEDYEGALKSKNIVCCWKQAFYICAPISMARRVLRWSSISRSPRPRAIVRKRWRLCSICVLRMSNRHILAAI